MQRRLFVLFFNYYTFQLNIFISCCIVVKDMISPMKMMLCSHRFTYITLVLIIERNTFLISMVTCPCLQTHIPNQLIDVDKGSYNI